MDKIAILEGLLYIAGDDGISINQVCETLEIDNYEAKDLIDELVNYYKNNNRGICINLYGNKYMFTTKPEYIKYYSKFTNSKENNLLSQSALETLAIIAYNEPITRVEIDEIRGVNSGYVIRKLIAKNFICECGKSTLPGKPLMYKTTNDFLKHFGISDLSKLPDIKEVNIDNKEIDLFKSTEIRQDENLEIIN